MINYKLLIWSYLIISYILALIFIISCIVGDLRYYRKISIKYNVLGFLIFPLFFPIMIFYWFRDEIRKNLEGL